MLQPGLRLLVLRQLSFQLAAVPANLSCLLLGAFPTPGLFGQRLCQQIDLLLHFDLGRLQLLGSRFKLGLFSAGTLLLCL